MKNLREAGSTRTDRLTLDGEPEAHEAINAAESKFIPANTPGIKDILEDPVWDKTGSGIAALNGTLPYGWTNVKVGASVWSHFPPSGWDDDFGGAAITGGDHKLELYWVCCDPVSSASHVVTP